MKTVSSKETGEVIFEWDRKAGHLQIGNRSYRCGPDYVVIDNRRVPFWVHKRGLTWTVWLDGEVYTFEVDDPRQRGANPTAGAASGGTVKAQMPGKILRVEVKAGDVVQVGDNLLLMESMKMELAMDTPVAGTVKRVEVSPDQMVAQGDLLVEIEEE